MLRFASLFGLLLLSSLCAAEDQPMDEKTRREVLKMYEEQIKPTLLKHAQESKNAFQVQMFQLKPEVLPIGEAKAEEVRSIKLLHPSQVVYGAQKDLISGKKYKIISINYQESTPPIPADGNLCIHIYVDSETGAFPLVTRDING